MPEIKRHVPQLRPSDIKRFWEKVDVRAEHECWNWKSSITPAGYGQMSIRNYPYAASRISWAINSGASSLLHICHRCDNPACVNPHHLFEGTHKQNMEDMTAKNRGNKGERHYRTKLKESDILEIRLLKFYGATQQSIADAYGVGRLAILKILHGQRWSHI